ncbi:MAG: hypothetical protein ACLP8S_07290 [Solirubrobacteraceae bacterium]
MCAATRPLPSPARTTISSRRKVVTGRTRGGVIAIATLRAGSRKTSLMIDSADGTVSAAPTPITARHEVACNSTSLDM